PTPRVCAVSLAAALPLSSHLLRVQRALHSLGKAFRSPHAPEVQKQNARILASHVLVNRNDVDARRTQGLEHPLQLGLEHREIPVDRKSTRLNSSHLPLSP